MRFIAKFFYVIVGTILGLLCLATGLAGLVSFSDNNAGNGIVYSLISIGCFLVTKWTTKSFSALNNSSSPDIGKSKFTKQVTFKITMLGARGAGKTSLLAGILDEFQSHAKDLWLQLSPDDSTRIALSNTLAELRSAVETITVGGYSGTTQLRTYDFELGLPLREPVIKLEFKDYPGEWFNDIEKSENIINYIRESNVVLWAIDAAALMEKDGAYDETFNNTMNIRSLVAKAFQKWPINHKKLFLLVPIKCETYLKDGRSAELLKKIEDAYACTLKQNDHDMGLAITSVQTLGNVRFHHIEKGPNGVLFVHSRTSRDHPYAPKHVDQIPNYILPFILRRYLGQTSIADNNVRKNFELAIQEMSIKRIRSEQEGFKILQGEKLIN